MINQKLSTQAYKGTSDLMAKNFLILKYITDVWRKVCLRFGYNEYLTPVLELADLYRAKSGEIKEELFIVKDRADRELAMRAEMTPSVTRMVSGIYKGCSKPIRLFSIANFFRDEAPQKGRSREFWQLNADIFGASSINADIEVLSLAIEIMKEFRAPIDSFKLYFNSRILLDEFFTYTLQLTGQQSEVARIMDKFDKISKTEFINILADLGLPKEKINKIIMFLTATIENFYVNFPELTEKEGFKQIKEVKDLLNNLGYEDYSAFKTSIIRGFDYYDGIVFEVYDMNPSNKRSLFGGGRYNGLSEIFGIENFPATGFAPGNVTTASFLENWNLIPAFEQSAIYYMPLLEGVNITTTVGIANQLRSKGLTIETDLVQKSFTDALRLANKRGFKKILILGENEIETNKITIKDFITGKQDTKSLENFLSELS